MKKHWEEYKKIMEKFSESVNKYRVLKSMILNKENDYIYDEQF